MSEKNPFSHLGKITVLATNAVVPYDNNPKLHGDRQIDKLVRSIESFGFNVPIIVDESNIVLAGHGRLAAAKKMGLDKVPAIILKHLSDVEKKAYRLADNKITEDSRYDESKLFAELTYLAEFGSFEVTGFTDSEMLALDMQAKALLEASTPASKPTVPAASLAGSEPSPAPSSIPGDPDPYAVGLEQENDHDPAEDEGQEDAPPPPSMVRIELIVDEEQRRAITAVLNASKTKHGVETLGQALHIVCLEWLEINK